MVRLFSFIALFIAGYLMAEPKVALVTGASRGIGKETALLLASEPDKFKVYGTYSRGPVKPGGMPGVTFLQMQLADYKSIQAVVAEIKTANKGRIDILINNAAIGTYGPVEALSHETIQEQFQVNLIGPVQLMREVLPVMRSNKYGRVINVSSTAGAVGLPMMDLYSGSKFGLEGVTAALAGYVGRMPDNADIRCRIIEPGYTRTDFAKLGVHANNIPDAIKELWNRFDHALKHGLATGQPPEDVALVIRKMIDEGPEAPFRVQPNKTRKALLENQGVDTSGNSLVIKTPLSRLYPK